MENIILSPGLSNHPYNSSARR